MILPVEASTKIAESAKISGSAANENEFIAKTTEKIIAVKKFFIAYTIDIVVTKLNIPNAPTAIPAYQK